VEEKYMYAQVIKKYRVNFEGDSRAEDYKTEMKTSFKSQASDWLKWQPVAISANQMLEI
jgi:hypothetical protein